MYAGHVNITITCYLNVSGVVLYTGQVSKRYQYVHSRR